MMTAGEIEKAVRSLRLDLAKTKKLIKRLEAKQKHAKG